MWTGRRRSKATRAKLEEFGVSHGVSWKSREQKELYRLYLMLRRETTPFRAQRSFSPAFLASARSK